VKGRQSRSASISLPVGVDQDRPRHLTRARSCPAPGAAGRQRRPAEAQRLTSFVADEDRLANAVVTPM
jgi:hypothetical protein